MKYEEDADLKEVERNKMLEELGVLQKELSKLKDNLASIEKDLAQKFDIFKRAKVKSLIFGSIDEYMNKYCIQRKVNYKYLNMKTQIGLIDY